MIAKFAPLSSYKNFVGIGCKASEKKEPTVFTAFDIAKKHADRTGVVAFKVLHGEAGCEIVDILTIEPDEFYRQRVLGEFPEPCDYPESKYNPNSKEARRACSKNGGFSATH